MHHAPHIVLRRALPRRQFLRGTGAALALPMLDAMHPAFAAPEPPARRMLAICNNLGLLDTGFFPKQQGKDYELSPYLKILEAYRDHFTVFSGVSHPPVPTPPATPPAPRRLRRRPVQRQRA